MSFTNLATRPTGAKASAVCYPPPRVMSARESARHGMRGGSVISLDGHRQVILQRQRERLQSLSADPAALNAARARRQEADARFARRLDRRAVSLGTVVLAPAGMGAKHYRAVAAERMRRALLEAVTVLEG